MPKEHLESTAPPQLSPTAIAALQKGNKIEAIKIVRQERNTGLKEAKDAVEQYLVSQPALQSSLAAQQTEVTARVLLWIAVILGAAIFAYRYF
jgi:ribosomal protein L7/L12